MASKPGIPRGMSRAGLRVSSAAVEKVCADPATGTVEANSA